jgi:hypothetical protein
VGVEFVIFNGNNFDNGNDPPLGFGRPGAVSGAQAPFYRLQIFIGHQITFLGARIVALWPKHCFIFCKYLLATR